MQLLQATTEFAVQAIYERLGGELTAGKRVLWLVSGGSNIALEVQIMQQLAVADSVPLYNLTIMPMDERYGPTGHSDSNSHQLRAAGFTPGTATMVDILAHNLPFSQTVDAYSNAISTALADAQAVIGQFGIGSDGHVAGIKPDSPATASNAATVIGYSWTDYERMTMSLAALQQITVAYLPAFGSNKKEALEHLRQNNQPFEKLPAKLLYDIAETYVYTDQII